MFRAGLLFPRRLHTPLNLKRVMEPVYYVILGLLFILACFDLVVGVSNDAANFLNSAIGSKVATRRTILLIASAGILFGSMFSSGMMEIARSGVFSPGQFYFHDIMMIFLAVMLADIILLDLFNTYGLPTSTTVSIVFELLGAAVAVAIFKINSDDVNCAQTLAPYINSSKALAIISGILSSVVIAFVCGSSVMWFSRLLFSFNYKHSFRYIGALWCGFALTAITYFAIFKGLKGSSLVNKQMLTALNEHIWLYVAYAFVGWSLLMFALQWLFRLEIIKISVLAGTFALAMAFAGNDLVNFIGVFMAGMSAVEIAGQTAAAGGDTATLLMSGLEQKVAADWRFLGGAGLIMVLTLMFSRKARSVSDTEVNLARKGSGVERFGSTPPARMLVRGAMRLSNAINMLLPTRVNDFIERRFAPPAEAPANGASFDLIRASVNLTVASLLISLATSLKLPLSTTYVTFMVAMGSSLADKAWGRDSAVYRITGVLTVISGWFFTAFAAFSMAFVVALAFIYGGNIAIVLVVALVGFLLYKNFQLHRKRSAAGSKNATLCYRDSTTVVGHCSQSSELMVRLTDIYISCIDSLQGEDRKSLKRLRKESRAIKKYLQEKMACEVMPLVQGLPQQHADLGKRYIQLCEYSSSVAESVSIISQQCFTYIDNNHQGLGDEVCQQLKDMIKPITGIFPRFAEMVKNNDFSPLKSTTAQMEHLDEVFAEAVKDQIVLKSEDEIDTRRSLLYLNLLNETRTMLRKAHYLAKVQYSYLMDEL